MNRISWSRYKKLTLEIPELPLLLDLSRTSLADEALGNDPLLLDAFPEAFEAMDALEKGAIANPAEGRQVGHYWLRAPHLAPSAEMRQTIEETRDRVLAFAADVHSGRTAPENGGRFESFLLIGIGGSALGPQFVADALTSPSDQMRPFFLDNTDPDGMARELLRIEKAGGLEKTLTIVVSKSGGTKETRNGMLEAAEAYHKKGLNFARHAVAVTQEGSPLDQKAVSEGWITRFPMWDWVGGRTSVLSAVGLLPASLQGIDVLGMIEGAAACDVATRQQSVEKNPAALLALTWFRETGGRGGKDMVVLPYKDRLLFFSRYLQQLVMESLGKEKDNAGNVVNQGIAVYGNKGSTDQHAFVQQLRDGILNFFVTFIEVLEDRSDMTPSFRVEEGVTSGDYLLGFFLGTRQALSDKGRASLTVTVRDISPRSLGILIALYERAVGLYASLIGINAYHQPGVEAGKKASAEILSLQKRVVTDMEEHPGSFRTIEEIAASLGGDGLEENIYKILEHLAANPDRGIKIEKGAESLQSRYGC